MLLVIILSIEIRARTAELPSADAHSVDADRKLSVDLAGEPLSFPLRWTYITGAAKNDPARHPDGSRASHWFVSRGTQTREGPCRARLQSITNV